IFALRCASRLEGRAAACCALDARRDDGLAPALYPLNGLSFGCGGVGCCHGLARLSIPALPRRVRAGCRPVAVGAEERAVDALLGGDAPRRSFPSSGPAPCI